MGQNGVVPVKAQRPQKGGRRREGLPVLPSVFVLPPPYNISLKRA